MILVSKFGILIAYGKKSFVILENCPKIHISDLIIPIDKDKIYQDLFNRGHI